MRRKLAPLTLVLVLALVPSLGRPGSRGAKSDLPAVETGRAFDARAGAARLGPTKQQTAAMADLVREHPDVAIRWNARFGTPASILRHGATLTGPRAGAPVEAARAWLSAHAALYGWTRAAVGTLDVEKVLTQPNGGPTAVLFHQVFGGLEAGNGLGGSIVVALDRANRVLSVRASTVRAPQLASGVRLKPADAVKIVSGVAPAASDIRRGEWTQFARGKFAAPSFARPIAFPIADAPARPAFEVDFTRRLDDRTRTIVDAITGEVLYRASQIRREAPEGRIFPHYPGAPKGGEHEKVSFAGDPTASPEGWLSPASPVATTTGNNADTATHWGALSAVIAPEGAGQLRPIAPNGVFDFAFPDAWSTSNCGKLPVPGGFPDAPTYALDAIPAVVNLFYHHNLMHDFFYKLGFDERAGALQRSNFGRTGPGKENDPLLGLAQAGAVGGDGPLGLSLGRDNAYMATFDDGLPSWSAMFLYEPLPGVFEAQCKDGDFDTGVIYHEYTHAVTNRWVGGEIGNIDGYHGGSMGEGWSDFFAAHYLYLAGLASNTNTANYVTGNLARGDRNWAIANVTAGFGDLAYGLRGAEVHDDGEIWSGMLWALRSALERARPHGAALAGQLIADAMPISGPNPTMLDMRDAILAADMARSRGANQAFIWDAFAGRGFGKSASAEDDYDGDPIPAFDTPDPKRNAIVKGKVVDAVTGLPIASADVIVGVFERFVSPATVTAADGTFRLPMAAGTYSLTIHGAGFGAQTRKLRTVAGRIQDAIVKLSPNYASRTLGAEVVRASTSAESAEAALDEDSLTAWSAPGPPRNASFVVRLAGEGPVSVDEIRISAFPGTTNGFSALSDWTTLFSLDGKTFKPLVSGSFKNAPPWPVAPELNYRSWKLATPVSTRFIKFVARSNQSALASATDTAEVQVFGRGDAFRQKPLPPESFHSEGRVLVATPEIHPTLELMAVSCQNPPPTQGLDAWVTEIPPQFADGFHNVTAKIEPLVPDPLPDGDVFFLADDCSQIDALASGNQDESGNIPSGTRYVVQVVYTTFGARTILDAAGAPSVWERMPKPAVEDKKSSREQLPATGIASMAAVGRLLMVPAALGITGWSVRRARRKRTRRLRSRATGRIA